jgi:predicted  nucleic acid-binding Zn-ribbon protein
MPTVTELRQQLATLQGTILNKTNIVNDRQNLVNFRLTNLNNKISQQRSDEVNYTNAVNAYGQKLNAQNIKKTKHDHQVDNLAQEMNTYNDAVTIQRRKMTDYNEQYDELNQEIARYNGLIQDPNANNNEITTLKNHILSEKARLQQVLSGINAENQRLRQSVTNINNKRDALAREKDELDQTDRDLLEEIQSINTWGERKQATASQIDREQADINQEMGVIESLNAELKQLSSISESLKRQINELENTDNPFVVSKGQFTFEAEGTEGGPNHSRKPTVPDNNSGVTIGRGYDLKERTATSIINDLVNFGGITLVIAQVFSLASGLVGAAARKYIDDNNLNDVEITPAGQKALFIKAYGEMESDVIRICNKADTVSKYGHTDWDTLHPKIRDMVVDLRYQGLYRTATREFLQPLIVHNDLEGFANVMTDPTIWQPYYDVTTNRFHLRAAYFSGDLHPLVHPLNLKNIANTPLKLFAATTGTMGMYTLSNLNNMRRVVNISNRAIENAIASSSVIQAHANNLTRIFSASDSHATKEADTNKVSYSGETISTAAAATPSDNDSSNKDITGTKSGVPSFTST